MKAVRILEKIIEPKKTLPGERKRYSNRELIALAVPVIIEQLLMLLVGMADTLMISYAGEAAVSGVALVDQVNILFIYVFSAVAAGGSVVTSQYFGRQDRENGGNAASQLLMASVLAALLIMTVSITLRRGILHLLFGHVEEDVMTAALRYLVITAFSFPALAAYNSCAGVFRSMGKTRVVMRVSILVNAINVTGNYIGVIILKKGVAGVAYPTLLARCVGASVLIVMLSNPKEYMHLTLRGVFSWRSDMLGRIMAIAVPAGLENGLFQVAKLGVTSITARFGTSQIAANGVAQTFWGLASAVSFMHVFTTVIGQCMGAGDAEAADYYMSKIYRLAMVGSVIWSCILFALSPLFLAGFSLTPETRRLTFFIIYLHNFFAMFLFPSAFAMPSGLRAAGDARYTLLAAIFATVVCRVAFAYLFGIVFNMGVVGVVIGMILDWTVKSVLILLRWRSGRWKTMRVID